VALDGGAKLTTTTPLALVASGSRLRAYGYGGYLGNLVNVSGTGSKYTASGTVLDIQDASVEIGLNGFAGSGGSVFAFRDKSQGSFQGGGPLIRVWGGSPGFSGAGLSAVGGLGDSDGTGNIITINGTGVPVGSAVMLDARNATVNFGSGRLTGAGPDLDVFSINAPAGVPLIRLDGARLVDSHPSAELLSFSNGPTAANRTSTFTGLLLYATNGSEIATSAPLVGLWGGQDVTSTADPSLALLQLENSSATVAGTAVVGLDESSKFKLSSLLLRTSGGAINSDGPLLGIRGNATLTSSNADSLIALTNGASLFNAAGGSFASPVIGLNNGESRIDQNWDTSTTRDLKMTGSGSLVKVDAAILAATAPVVAAIRSAIEVTGSATKGAIDFNNASTGSVGLAGTEASAFQMNNGFFKLSEGPAIRVAGGSQLNITGPIAILQDGSRFLIMNGPLVSVEGAGSVLNASGGVVEFRGIGSQMFIKNSITPTATQFGIPVSGTNININTSTPVLNGTIQSGTGPSGSNTLTINPGASVIRTTGGGAVNIGVPN
jgi:hypothetical protein